MLRELVVDSCPFGWEKIFTKYRRNLELICSILDRPNVYPYYPRDQEIFSLFYMCPPERVRIIILGESPFSTLHPDGVTEATGIAFSGRPGYKIPSSTRNIYTELDRQIPGLREHQDGDLSKWVEQGVFLLNTSLTYHPKNIGKKGEQTLKFWTGFISKIITEIALINPNIIILSWGKIAREFTSSSELRSSLSNVVKLECGHPANLNRNNYGDSQPSIFSFYRNDHFLECNRIFRQRGAEEIDWNTH
jgi:uracil-DNA glycosylase